MERETAQNNGRNEINVIQNAHLSQKYIDYLQFYTAIGIPGSTIAAAAFFLVTTQSSSINFETNKGENMF